MGYDDRYGDDDRYQSRGRERGSRDRWQERGQNWGQDRGYGRDPQDRNPGGHVDYYRGGDRGQRRTGPEGGFESRDDYRRTSRYADQGQSWGGRNERSQSDDRSFSERGHGGSGSNFSGSGGVGSGMGFYGGNRDSGYGTDDAVGYSTGGNQGPGYDPSFGGPRFDRQDVGSTGTHGAHPVASPYGGSQSGFSGGGGIGSGGSARAQAILDEAGHDQGEQGRGGQGMGGQRGQSSRTFDPHYSEWRRQQIEALDRDYQEYCQENSSRFEREFGSWREKRGQQRQSMGRVTEHMEVVGSDDQHVGTVDKVKDGRIILTKSDPNAGGHHHSIPCGWLESVDDKVRLNKSAEEAMRAWRDEETSRALFEDKESGSEGPHILERSFSGTYRDEK
jgi:hypothetical protein